MAMESENSVSSSSKRYFKNNQKQRLREKKVHVKRCKSVNLIIKLKGHYCDDAFNANFRIKYFDL